MIEKDSNATDKYKLNDGTTLTVKNKKLKDELGNTYYRSEVTLKHKVSGENPLVFGDSDEISDFVCNIDLSDDQLSLLEKEQA